jgi:hypothetical protein
MACAACSLLFAETVRPLSARPSPQALHCIIGGGGFMLFHVPTGKGLIRSCLGAREAETNVGPALAVPSVRTLTPGWLGPSWVGKYWVQSSVASIENDSGCRFACRQCVLCMIISRHRRSTLVLIFYY